MSKKTLFSLSLSAIALALLVPCYAGAPMKIAAVAPVADLVSEAEGKIKVLEETLSSDTNYKQARMTTLPSDAGVLAILAQAVAETEENAAWKGTAADLRDAAIAIADSKTYDEAKAGLEGVKAALGGKAGGAKVDFEWNKLAKLNAIMSKEVSRRQGQIRRVTIKTAKAKPETAAPSASVLAVIAVAIHDDLHETKGAQQGADWQKYAKQMQADMTALAAELRKNDREKSAESFKKSGASCNDCHTQIRDKNKGGGG